MGLFSRSKESGSDFTSLNLSETKFGQPSEKGQEKAEAVTTDRHESVSMTDIRNAGQRRVESAQKWVGDSKTKISSFGKRLLERVKGAGKKMGEAAMVGLQYAAGAPEAIKRIDQGAEKLATSADEKARAGLSKGAEFASDKYLQLAEGARGKWDALENRAGDAALTLQNRVEAAQNTARQKIDALKESASIGKYNALRRVHQGIGARLRAMESQLGLQSGSAGERLPEGA